MTKRLRDPALIFLLGLSACAYSGSIKISTYPGKSTVIQNTNPRLTPMQSIAYTAQQPARPNQDFPYAVSGYIPTQDSREAGLVNLFDQKITLEYPADSLEKAVQRSAAEPLVFDAKYNGTLKSLTYDTRCTDKVCDSMTIVGIDRDVTPTELCKKQIVKDVVMSMFRDDMKDYSKFSIKYTGTPHLLEKRTPSAKKPEQKSDIFIYEMGYCVSFGKNK